MLTPARSQLTAAHSETRDSLNGSHVTDSQLIDQHGCHSSSRGSAPLRSHWPLGTSVNVDSCCNRAGARSGVPLRQRPLGAQSRHPIGQTVIHRPTYKNTALRLARLVFNHTDTSRWLAGVAVRQRPIVRGLVQERGRIPPWARSSRLAESECRHERWVGIKTLVFILHSTS